MRLTVRSKDIHLENLSGFCKTVVQSEILGGAASTGKQAILNVPVKMIQLFLRGKKFREKNGELKKIP